MSNTTRCVGIVCLSLAYSISVRANVVEDSCGFIWTVGDGETEVVEIPSLAVLETTKTEETLTFETDDGIAIQAIICWRDSVIPAENDYKVVEAGKPLYLQMSDEGELRTTVLEKSGGACRLRLINGETFSDEEREQVVAIIRHFNLSIR